MSERVLIMSSLLCLLIANSGVAPAFADWGNVDKINQNWKNIDDKLKANEDFWKKKPGVIQTPGAIQTPGTFRDVGEFRKALSEGKVIKAEVAPCHRRFCVGADTLFNFDEASLTPYAEETLRTLAPMIQKLGPHPMRVEGHTDSEGTDQYNQKLSERRAERVKNWLVQNHVIDPSGIQMEGFGESRPKAPNKHPDGSDDPLGRAANRRVEIIVDTCTKLEVATNPPSAAAVATTSDGSAQSATTSAGSGQSDDEGGDANAAGANGGGSSSNGGADMVASASVGQAGNSAPSPLSTVDLSELLPYSNLFSSEEIKSGFNRLRIIKPVGGTQLSITVSAPNDFEEKSLDVTADQLAQDKVMQIPLVALNPKGDSNVRLEVRYIRADSEESPGSFVKSYAQKTGLQVLGRQPGDFNGRQVEDALLRDAPTNKPPTVTRLTASRQGDRIFLVSSTCPEKDYSKWKKIFGLAAVSFSPEPAN